MMKKKDKQSDRDINTILVHFLNNPSKKRDRWIDRKMDRWTKGKTDSDSQTVGEI